MRSLLGSCLSVILVAAVALPALRVAAHPKVLDHRAFGYRKEMKIRLQRTVGRDGRPQFRIDFVDRAMGWINGHGVKVYLGRRLVHLNDNVRAGRYDWQPPSVLPQAEGEDSLYLVVNVCDHHDHIGVATAYLDGSGLSSSLGLLPADDETADYLEAEDFDFTLRGVRLACCGHGALWSDGPIGNCSVRVETPGDYN
jgi:hypothetical protein